VTFGYRPGDGLLHRTHPFTIASLAGAVSVLAFVLPGVLAPWGLVAGLCVLAAVSGLLPVLRTAAAFSAPFWGFLILIHGVFRDDLGTAVVLAGRISAMLTVFLLLLASVHPGRLVDAMLERGAPFGLAYLFGATLQAVPQLQRRAAAILDAQRCRGLRVRGSLVRRARAVIPLAVPLVLGALAEVDERALALEIRGAGSGARRTPLDPPRDGAVGWLVRWFLLAAVIGAVLWRLLS
jgi:energy-coupling factor transport system permease protein